MADNSRVDFKALKAITFEQAIGFLRELKLTRREGDQLRFPCPNCKGNDARALSINPQKGFRCFEGKGKDANGTDAVALVAHVRGIRNYEAGRLLEEHFLGKRHEEPRATSPENVVSGAGGRTDLAAMLGISPAAISALGIEKGERLTIPLRTPHGVVIGTIGIATNAEQKPLLLFTFDEAATAPQKHGQDELRKLLRVI